MSKQIKHIKYFMQIKRLFNRSYCLSSRKENNFPQTQMNMKVIHLCANESSRCTSRVIKVNNLGVHPGWAGEDFRRRLPLPPSPPPSATQPPRIPTNHYHHLHQIYLYETITCPRKLVIKSLNFSIDHLTINNDVVHCNHHHHRT